MEFPIFDTLKSAIIGQKLELLFVSLAAGLGHPFAMAMGGWNDRRDSRMIGARITLALTLFATPAIAQEIPVCAGSHRAERRLTCVVDGDTGWEAGVKWRALAGDTPEIGKPECAAERRLGEKARDRLRALMAGGYRIEWTGRTDYYRRQLAAVRLSDGRDASQVLIEEGLARPWPNKGNKWCGR